MNRHCLKVTLVLLVALLLFPGVSFGSGEGGAVDEADNRFMFTDEVKPGMKGYGLTVFSGTKIERFDAEIISVIYGIGPRSDTILARISGGPLENTGVIAGMSGSPVYIEGRMIGALAYSWSFSKEAIAGITPIGEMLRLFDFSDKKRESSDNDSTAWARPANFGARLPAGIPDSADMRPVMTPMVFSGFSYEAIDLFRNQLEEWGVVPVVGGSFSERLPDTDVSLEEGAAIGIQLIRGDMNAAAIGTVTLVEDGKVLGFGHPFMLAGSVDFPMTTAYVHTVLPSMIVSTKVSSPLKPVGTLNQDRSEGIAGVLGGVPDMVPLTLRIQKEEELSTRDFSFEIVRSRRLLPQLVGMALGESLTQAVSRGGEFGAKINYEIEIEGFPTIRNDDFISGLRRFPTLTSMGLFRDLRALLNNQFEELTLKSISMNVEVRESVESAQIMGVRIGKTAMRPGERIDLKIMLKPYMKDSFDEQVTLDIPEHFPEGNAFVQVSAAPQTVAFERMRASHQFRPDSAQRFVELVDMDYPGNRIDIRLLVSDPGIVISGREMPALPSSVFSVISQTKGKEPIGITRSSVMLDKHVFFDFEVSGASMIPIIIDHKAQ